MYVTRRHRVEVTAQVEVTARDCTSIIIHVESYEADNQLTHLESHTTCHEVIMWARMGVVRNIVSRTIVVANFPWSCIGGTHTGLENNLLQYFMDLFDLFDWHRAR